MNWSKSDNINVDKWENGMTQPLAYMPGSTGAEKRRFRFLYAVYLVETCAATLLLLLVLMFVPSRFADFFKDFRADLPVVTVMVLHVSTALRGGLWMLALPVAFALPLLPAYASMRKRTAGTIGLTAFYFLMTMGGAVAAIALVVIALYLPLLKVIQNVSGATS